MKGGVVTRGQRKKLEEAEASSSQASPQKPKSAPSSGEENVVVKKTGRRTRKKQNSADIAGPSGLSILRPVSDDEMNAMMTKLNMSSSSSSKSSKYSTTSKIPEPKMTDKQALKWIEKRTKDPITKEKLKEGDPRIAELDNALQSKIRYMYYKLEKNNKNFDLTKFMRDALGTINEYDMKEFCEKYNLDFCMKYGFDKKPEKVITLSAQFETKPKKVTKKDLEKALKRLQELISLIEHGITLHII